MLITLALFLLLANSINCVGSESAPVPECEQIIPGTEFGGSVLFPTDCVWRPQVHFISALSGNVEKPDRPIRAAIITLNTSLPLSTSSSGPSRLIASNVVLRNFSLPNPAGPGPVLWPSGLLQPGLQPGSTQPRRLYLVDVKILTNSESLQQYRRFFEAQPSVLTYSDNATFLHVSYWTDETTVVHNVGLLLDVPELSPLDMSGPRPVAGRNFVLASNQDTLVPLLRAAVGPANRLPYLVYLSANITLTARTGLGAGLPVNRPVLLVGKVSDTTSLDFGMEVNQLVLGGNWSSVTFARVVLENLGPGDARTSATAGRYDVFMSYNVWPALFDRSQRRLALHNSTLVLPPLDMEEFLYKATLFEVQPAGFEEQLRVMNMLISSWTVSWSQASNLVVTQHLLTTSMSVLECNYSTSPVVAPALPLPARANDTSLQAADAALQHALVHVDDWGLEGLGVTPGGLRLSELVLITTNLSFASLAAPQQPGHAPPEQQLLDHMLGVAAGMRHVLMGIVDPPVLLDLAYSTDLYRLPADKPAGHMTLVNLHLNHLAQGPRVALPSANMMMLDVWTVLLWAFPRAPQGELWLSNVTLWLPAGEFSYFRSYTTSDKPTDFRVDLEGGQYMLLSGVVDLRADGLYVRQFQGPGMAADSLSFKVEPGWSMDGPPKGFWTNPQPAGQQGRLSDTMVTVLSVSLVTTVVTGVLACLAVVFWRKRTAEVRAAAALAAAAELGKIGASTGGASGQDGSSGGPPGAGGGSGGRRCAALGGQLALLVPPADGVLDAPVHDSSNSYHAPDRAALTQELARSQFGHRGGHGGSGSDEGDGDGGGAPWLARRVSAPGGGGPRPPAASGGGPSGTSTASDAALQRLHSAITSLSQDVLSRRLTGYGNSSAAPGLGRSSVPESVMQHGEAAAAAATAAPAAAGGSGGLQLHASGSQLAAVSVGSAGSGRAAVAAAAADEDGDAAANGGGSGGAAAAAAAAAAPAAATGAATPTPGSSSGGGSASAGFDQLKLLQLVGQGTFGQVYKALWRRRCVAVKVLQLPATAGSSDVSPWMGVGRASSHREKMAVMETVVSTTMSHPNIVQVYTYVLQPLMQGSLPTHKKFQRQQSSSGRVAAPAPAAALQQQQQQHPTPPLLADQPEHQQQQLQLWQRLLQQEERPREQQQPGVQPLQQQQAPAQRGGMAAFFLRQQQQAQQDSEQQQRQPQSPFPGARGGAAAAFLLQHQQNGKAASEAAANGSTASSTSPLPAAAAATAAVEDPGQQQQQLVLAASHSPRIWQQELQGITGSGSKAANCNDSSQSLVAVQQQQQQQGQELKRLTPEMAAAAAAALPAAAAAAAGGGADHTGSSSSSQQDLGDAGGGPNGPVLVGWELRLVMEFCDAGSLRTALDHKLLIDRTTGLPALECVLFLAHDVACAMIHLHSEHLLHGDLKASNVLLKRTAPRLPVTPAAQQAAGRHRAGQLVGLGLGLMAKVADFGLSLTLGPAETHVSQMHMGTLTHMAPELLLHGRASKASDVYAYGILLWELATGRRPYSGTPVGMLAHKVAQQGWRPAWPGGASLPVRQLVEACWAQEAADRPCFNAIVQRLEDMAAQLEQLKQQQAQQMAAAAAPLHGGSSGQPDVSEFAHELTPSMMADLMPSGFSAGTSHSGQGLQGEELQLQDSGVLYEMDQLSGGSHTDANANASPT